MRLGTRGSKLALAQAEKVCQLLREKGVDAKTIVVKTSGDVQKDRPLYMLKGYGAFVREIDDLLLKGDVDAAVHSLKDLPTVRPKELVTAAVLPRESALDVAILRNAARLADLPVGSKVGTSSTRRAALIRRHYPGLETEDIRGNVDTRLRKLMQGDYDAILVAEAGLIRLGVNVQTERLDPYSFMPAANQGVIAVVARKDSEEAEILKGLNDEATWLETRIERTIAGCLDGGCVVPMGVYARLAGAGVDVACEVLSLDGRQHVTLRETIPAEGWEEHAMRLAERLALSGGRALADAARKELNR